jgi:hypothetical protein
MSVYDKLEKWKNGNIYYVNRDLKGRFSKSIHEKFYTGQQVGVWNKESQQKIVEDINHKEFVKGEYYRASISLNVPLNGTKGKPNYKNFTYVVVDLKENINIDDMYNELIHGLDGIESHLHYKQVDFWFDSSKSDCDIQYPKPYSARSSSTTFEGTDY